MVTTNQLLFKFLKEWKQLHDFLKVLLDSSDEQAYCSHRP